MTKTQQPGAPPPKHSSGVEAKRPAEEPAERPADKQRLAKVMLGVDAVAKKELKRLKRAQLKVRDRAVDKLEPDAGSSQSSVAHDRAYQPRPPGQDFGVAGVLLARQEIQTKGLDDAKRQDVIEDEDDLPTAEEIVAVARFRVRTFGRNYGVTGAWKSPNPRIPGNRRPDDTAISGLVGHWKSNHFCLDTLYQAGFDVPALGGDSEDAGWYPVAADLSLYAQGPGRLFNGVMSLRLESRTRKQRRARITELLGLSRAGDLLVAHYGPEEQHDSYQVSLVTANRLEAKGEIECAEACRDRARILVHTANDFVDALGMLLLRPVRPRYDDEE